MDLLEMSDGARIYLRRSGDPAGPRLLVSHGNGLAVDAFAGLCRALAETHELIAFDLRNHGRNPLHDLEGHSWQRFQADFVEILAALPGLYGARPTFGLFHSISGLTALRVAAAAPAAFAGLLVIEPPLLPPAGHLLHASFKERQDALVARTLKRNEHFADPADLVARLADRSEFRRFAPAALGDYAAAILRRDDAGGWRLACPRAYEAKIFDSNEDGGLYARLAAIRTPVRVLAGGEAGPAAEMAWDLAKEGGFESQTVPDSGHLMPMERPDVIAEITVSSIAGWQESRG